MSKVVLPVEENALYALGQRTGLPMSDIFSFIALRTATRYEALSINGDNHAIFMRLLLSPISLRSSALAMDEGNFRAVRQFTFEFPVESVIAMYQRIIALEATSSSCDAAGKVMRIARQLLVVEPVMRRLGMPDYISNYFPLADMPLKIGDATLVAYHLRVPMVPYERVPFAWSNYNREVQLYLHTAPLLINTRRMLEAFHQSYAEVLSFLVEASYMQSKVSETPAMQSSRLYTLAN